MAEAYARSQTRKLLRADGTRTIYDASANATIEMLQVSRVLGSSKYSHNINRTISMPRLRQLRLPPKGPSESLLFLQYLDAAPLEALCISVAAPLTFFAELRRFPIIQELSLQSLSGDMPLNFPSLCSRSAHLRKIAILRGEVTLVKMLLECRQAFPNLTIGPCRNGSSEIFCRIQPESHRTKMCKL